MPTHRVAIPTCTTCGSDDVVTDAFAKYDAATEQWELDSTYENTVCYSPECDGNECNLDWTTEIEIEVPDPAKSDSDKLQQVFDILTDWLVDRSEDHDDGSFDTFEEVDGEIDNARALVAELLGEI